MATGIVKFGRPKKGYGFIVPDDGSKDLFAHYSEIRSEATRRCRRTSASALRRHRPQGPSAKNIKVSA